MSSRRQICEASLSKVSTKVKDFLVTYVENGQSLFIAGYGTSYQLLQAHLGLHDDNGRVMNRDDEAKRLTQVIKLNCKAEFVWNLLVS